MKKPITIALLCLAVTPIIADAKTQRSYAAKAQFKAMQPCPSTGRSKGACPGYVIDHITALACGGADATYNMQWQTVQAAKAKDKWERRGCRR